MGTFANLEVSPAMAEVSFPLLSFPELYSHSFQLNLEFRLLLIRGLNNYRYFRGVARTARQLQNPLRKKNAPLGRRRNHPGSCPVVFEGQAVDGSPGGTPGEMPEGIIPLIVQDGPHICVCVYILYTYIIHYIFICGGRERERERERAKETVLQHPLLDT